jgi:hypothetical protein
VGSSVSAHGSIDQNRALIKIGILAYLPSGFVLEIHFGREEQTTFAGDGMVVLVRFIEEWRNWK